MLTDLLLDTLASLLAASPTLVVTGVALTVTGFVCSAIAAHFDKDTHQ